MSAYQLLSGSPFDTRKRPECSLVAKWTGGLVAAFIVLAFWQVGSGDRATLGAGLLFDSHGTSAKSFYDIALEHGTDKVTVHRYEEMYSKYLEPIRDRPLKVLEIGLGCDMNYGPGKSLYTWLDYLPKAELWFLEVDEACVKKWESSTPAKIVSGDQADPAVLGKLVTQSGGGFDVIIDDGGHRMKQQQASFDILFRDALKPGGFYFIEDLQTSYWPEYGGGLSDSTMEMVKNMTDDLHAWTSGRKVWNYPITRDVLSIDCMEEVCAFTKRKTPRRFPEP